jgi:hypothetical protein
MLFDTKLPYFHANALPCIVHMHVDHEPELCDRPIYSTRNKQVLFVSVSFMRIRIRLGYIEGCHVHFIKHSVPYTL